MSLRVIINWGDGSAHASFTVPDGSYPGHGPYDFTAFITQVDATLLSHSYTVEGDYTIEVSINPAGSGAVLFIQEIPFSVHPPAAHLDAQSTMVIDASAGPPQGSGQQKTYLTTTPAVAAMVHDVRLAANPPPASNPMKVNYAGFTAEDFVVIDGIPNGRPICEVRMFSRVGLGAYTYSDIPPIPSEVDTGAVLRWLPSPGTFTGDTWTPEVGTELNLVAQPTSEPTLDTGYSFQVRGGDEVSLPAVIFEDNAWMQIDNPDWSTNAFTVAIAAVMHVNPEGPTFGVIESFSTPVDDPSDDDPANLASTQTDWGIRYRQGIVEFWAGGVVVTHQVTQAQARPIVIVVSMSSAGGKLVVMDRTTSTRSLATDGIALFDTALYVGRTGGDFAPGQTAYMDVLEFDYWDRALDFEEMAELTHLLDSCYGVMG